MSTEPKVLTFATREEWLQARKEFITASDVAAILGFDKRRTAAHVYAEKRGLVDPEPDSPTLRRGRMLESSVVGWYAEDTGYSVERHEHRLEVHPDLPWLAASRDATAITPFKDRRNVEAKTARSRYGARGEEEDEKWGETGTDEVPRNYIPQTQIQMAVGGFDVTDVPVLIAGNDFRIYYVPRSPAFIDLAIGKLAEFMNMVRTGVPPPFDFTHSKTLELVQELYPNVESRLVELGAEWLDIATDLENVRAIGRAADKREKQIKALIFDAVGEAELGRVIDTPVVFCRQLQIKNFKPRPAERREEIHLKVKGLEDGEDRNSIAARTIEGGTAATGRAISAAN